MKNFLTTFLLVFSNTLVLFAADHGDVTDVREIDRLDPNGPYKRIWEPHLAKWSDQHLVSCYGLELRGKTDMGDIVCSISQDGGKTWSIAKPEPDLPNYRSKSFFGRDTRGRHIYVYSDSADRKRLMYKTKSPGEMWSAAKRFYHENNLNSYPTLAEDKPGQWIAVWDSSNEPDKKRTAIRFGRLKVE